MYLFVGKLTLRLTLAVLSKSRNEVLRPLINVLRLFNTVTPFDEVAMTELARRILVVSFNPQLFARAVSCCPKCANSTDSLGVCWVEDSESCLIASTDIV